MRQTWLVLVWGAGLVGLGGCVQRMIAVTSEPAGALVWLNDQEVGRTPLEVPFTFYGTYDVRLEKEGYAPLWTVGEADPPWWDYPGPDLVAELMPWGAESRVAWHYELRTLGEAERALDLGAGENGVGNEGGGGGGLVERARALREDTRAESDF